MVFDKFLIYIDRGLAVKNRLVMFYLIVSMRHASGNQLTRGEYRSVELNSLWISSNVFKEKHLQ